MHQFKAFCTRILIAAMLVGMMASCNSRSKKYVIAVVQCSQDSWREKLNAELQAATYFYDNVELRFANANDSVELQKRLLKQYADSGVDMIIVAPITSAEITPTVEQVMDSGIPVISTTLPFPFISAATYFPIVSPI